MISKACRLILVIMTGLVLVGLNGGPARADTLIPGGYIGDQIWGPVGSPYIIEGDVTIGGTLVIESGTTVLVSNVDQTVSGVDPLRVELTVIAGGAIDAVANPANPILFEGELSGYGTWKGIIVESGDVSFVNVSVAGAVEAMTTAPFGAGGQTSLWDTVLTGSNWDLVVRGNSPLVGGTLKVARVSGTLEVPYGASLELSEPLGLVEGALFLEPGSTYRATAISPSTSDLLQVSGVLSVQGVLDLDASSLEASPGDEIMLVEYLDAGPFGSEFYNLPEGMIWTEDGVELGITYVGNDGNDLVVEVDPLAWPDDDEWTPVTDAASGEVLTSPGEFNQFPFDLVGTTLDPVVFTALNSEWFFYRIRLAGSVLDGSNKFYSVVVSVLLEFGFPGSTNSFDYGIYFSGLDEELVFAKNLIEESAWCADTPEQIIASYAAPTNLSGSVRVVFAGSEIGLAGDDWFLDMRIPAADLLVELGELPSAADQVVVGTSTNPSYINTDSANLECSEDWSARVTGVVAIPDRQWAVHSVVPNPFNPRTAITFEVAEPGVMSLKIFDSKGRLVRLLTRGFQVPGVYEIFWDGIDDRGQAVASGIYFCQLGADGTKDVAKMALIR